MQPTRSALFGGLCLLLTLASGEDAAGAKTPTSDDTVRIVEIRSYNLKPGTRDRFHELFLTEAKPLLEQWGMEVVAYGPSLHDDDSWFLMRGFTDIEDRRRRQDDFYGSSAWREGPRDAVLAYIESYTTVVVPLDAGTIDGLTRLVAAAGHH